MVDLEPLNTWHQIFSLFIVYSIQKIAKCIFVKFCLVGHSNLPSHQNFNSETIFECTLCTKNFFEFFSENFEFFKKNFGKNFTKFIHIYRMNVPLLGAWILKIWAFAFKRIWNFLKTRFAIFWIEYAINVKNIVFYVFNGYGLLTFNWFCWIRDYPTYSSLYRPA